MNPRFMRICTMPDVRKYRTLCTTTLHFKVQKVKLFFAYFSLQVLNLGKFKWVGELLKSAKISEEMRNKQKRRGEKGGIWCVIFSFGTEKRPLQRQDGQILTGL